MKWICDKKDKHYSNCYGGGILFTNIVLYGQGKLPAKKKIDKKYAKKLLNDSGAWMFRNCYDWDCNIESNFWEIICDKNIPIEYLPSKTRNQIRRSLRDCDIKRISPQMMIDDDGYEVYKRSFRRYRYVTDPIQCRELWESGIKSNTKAEYWGVYEKESGKLIAWALNYIKGQSVDYCKLKAIPELMNKHYPYFGLLFEMNKYYLEEKGYSYVSDGWRSITEHSGIQPFLEKNFLFRKSFCQMRLYYAPWFGIVVKLLYPFRRFKYLPLSVRNVLRFEEINRKSCKNGSLIV